MKNRLRYHHITHPDGYRMTVASEVDESGKKVSFGFAFCSELDRFVKRIGRGRAFGAMHSKGHQHDFSGHSGDDLCKLWNSGAVKAPQAWKDTILSSVPEHGITVVKKVKKARL